MAETSKAGKVLMVTGIAAGAGILVYIIVKTMSGRAGQQAGAGTTNINISTGGGAGVRPTATTRPQSPLDKLLQGLTSGGKKTGGSGGGTSGGSGGGTTGGTRPPRTGTSSGSTGGGTEYGSGTDASDYDYGASYEGGYEMFDYGAEYGGGYEFTDYGY